MKHACAVALASISILFIAVANVSAEGDSESSKASAKSAFAKTYSCGFDSFSGYTAPGTNSSVNVGGVFTLTIDNTGKVTQSNAELALNQTNDCPESLDSGHTCNVEVTFTQWPRAIAPASSRSSAIRLLPKLTLNSRAGDNRNDCARRKRHDD